ncbi:hypothetical protein AGDE_13341 [Angomonas deanei]|uniref:START domain containing protein, putative n=1 Tax=Angomonas deanei TaxID=59799 RepID=A0A7G2CG07_9TRYP|nr:hypothetical protein AGDE_13341 [Angomonas deanei]CAD2218295.1 START domain containing protein, putative [Angomonas deanei]|eukprot:EPY22466.1 hypothetical protein AGDE_13341 [Angomonas deanei]
MTSVVPPPPVDLDQERLKVLLEYIPSKVRLRIKRLVRKAVTLFEGERHFEVLELLNRAVRDCETAETTLLPTAEGDVVTNRVRMITYGVAQPTLLSCCLFKRFITQSPMYVTSLEKVNAAEKLAMAVNSNKDWSVVKDAGAGSGTFYYYDEKKDLHYFKVITTVNVCALYLCGIVLELDLYKEWFPFCLLSQPQGDISRFHKSSFFVVKAPWPLSNREIFVCGYGVDDLERNGRIFAVANSIEESNLPPNVRPPPPNKEDNIRCNILYGGFLFEIVAPQRTKVSFIMSIDPKIPNIPQKALNWVSGKVVWQMQKEIEAAAIKSMEKNSKYYQRRRERKEEYELLRCRYNEYLERMYPGTAEQYKLDEDY